MRKLAVILLVTLIIAGCEAPRPVPVNPNARLNPEKSYTVVYWDVKPPWALDPKGVYRPTVEGMIAEFRAANPTIAVEVRWFGWAEGETRLAEALRDGAPPDIWADWQGIARRDHVLQIPAELWLNQEEITPAGNRAVSHLGQIWAWPRWLWPGGLLTLRSSLNISDEDVKSLAGTSWNWDEFGAWLEETDMNLDINDWQGGFSSQAMLASTGHTYRQWGGQELNQVFTALELLERKGRVTGAGEYRKITEGKNIIGGFAPAYVTWLAENRPEEKPVILPIPAVSTVNYIPVSATNLIQFRQLNYKGDEHSLAAAKLAKYLAVRQADELAAVFWAAPAWAQSAWQLELLPPWYGEILQTAVELGIPQNSSDRLGREQENKFLGQAGLVLADFWAGKADALDAARLLEELK